MAIAMGLLSESKSCERVGREAAGGVAAALVEAVACGALAGARASLSSGAGGATGAGDGSVVGSTVAVAWRCGTSVIASETGWTVRGMTVWAGFGPRAERLRAAPRALRGFWCALVALLACLSVGAAGAQGSANPALTGMSCPTSMLCVAVSSTGAVLWSTAPAGGAATWRSAVIERGVRLTGVSCSEQGLCAAIDTLGDVLVSRNPLAGAATWHSRRVAGEGLSSIACPSRSLCVASDADVVVSSSDPGSPRESWRLTHANQFMDRFVSAGALDTLGPLVCPSVSLCFVSLSTDGTDSSDPLGSGWGVARSSDPAGGAWRVISAELFSDPEASYDGYLLDALACASMTACVAAEEFPTDCFDNSSPDAGTTAVYCDGEGYALASARTTAMLGALRSQSGVNVRDGLNFASAACASAGLCVVTNWGGTLYYSTNPTASRPRWSRTRIDVGDGAIAGINCPATTLCLAFGPSNSSGSDIFVSDRPTGGPSTWVGIDVLRTPARTAAPELSGTLTRYGQLRCTRGRWTDATSFAYGWNANGILIPGASSDILSLNTWNDGEAITCTVTASNAFGQHSATSAPVRIHVPYVPGCPAARGSVGFDQGEDDFTGTFGPFSLGLTRANVLRLGHGSRVSSQPNTDVFCLTPGVITVVYPSKAVLPYLWPDAGYNQGRVVAIWSTNPSYTLQGTTWTPGPIGRGSTLAAAKATLGLERLACTATGAQWWASQVGSDGSALVETNNGLVMGTGIVDWLFLNDLTDNVDGAVQAFLNELG